MGRFSRVAARLITVAVVFAAGAGMTAAAASAPNPQAPGPPTLKVISSSATGATLWVADFYSAAPITSYTITGEPGDVTVSVPDHNADFLVSGLSVGTTYTFTAVANTDAYGPGYPSNPVTVTPAPNPNLPGRPVLARYLFPAGDGSVHVTWRAPADDGGSPITAYTIQWRAEPTWPDDPPFETTTVPASELSYDITGLLDQTGYEVDIRASNAQGDSPWFGDGFENLLTAQPPTDLQMAPAGPNELHVSWTAPSKGTPIVSYHATATDPDDSSHDVSLSTSDTQATLNVLNDLSYTVQVTAVDGSNATSAALSGQAPMTHAVAPDAPALTLVSSGSGEAQLNITPPAYDGGATISGYTIVDSAHGIAQSASAGANTVSGLTNATTYTFSAIATNSAGPSVASQPVSVTPLGVPGAPRVSAKPSWYGLTATVATPSTNGGSPVARYTLTLTGPGISTKTFTRTTPGAVAFTGLAPLTTYTLQVSALSAVGTSSATVGSVRTTALPPVVYIPNTPYATTLVPGQSVMTYGQGIFSVGSAAINPTARAQLLNLAHELRATKAIVCKGFADNGVDSLANWWLGLARAQNVCNALKADGIKATTSIVSYGGTQPMWSRRAVVFTQS